jgi:MraZ protein
MLFIFIFRDLRLRATSIFVASMYVEAVAANHHFPREKAVLTGGSQWICLGNRGAKWWGMVAMLLTGTFVRALDEKQRLAIPKPIRDALHGPTKTVFYIAPGTDGSLAIYPEDSFSTLAEQLATASPVGPDVRAFSRLFYAQAQRAELDRNGRLRIPAELAQLASLGREVVLLGVRDHIELWDRIQWDEYLSNKQPQYDDIAESAFATPSRAVRAVGEIPQDGSPAAIKTGPAAIKK